jgi:hypothetical protein
MHLTIPNIMARKIGFKQRDVRYERPGEAGIDHDPHAIADMALAKKVGDALQRHYPDHPWMVEVNHAQGVIMISLPIVMAQNKKFVIHVSSLLADPGLRSVMRAGGEILERYKVPRAGFSLDRFLEARAANPVNQRRRFIIED